MANGSRHSMSYIAESTYGVTPATPVMKNVRHVSTTLGLSKEVLQSEELRADRQIADFRHGAYSVGGEVGIELSYGSYDDLLEAAFAGTWTTSRVNVAVNLAVAIGPVTFTRASGSWITEGFQVGDAVVAAGFTNPGNNGRWRITALTATVMTVTPLAAQTAVVEASTAGRTISSDSQLLKAGTTRRSFTFERYFADIAGVDKPYHRFTGVEVNSMQLQVNANAMITGTLGLMGQDANVNTAIIAGATYPPATTTSPLDSFTGTLSEAGTLIAVITEIQINLDNGLESRFVVGSKKSLQASIGRSNVSGQVTAFFENSTLLEKFINETTSSIQFTLPDAAGNKFIFTLPRIKYTGGQPDVSGEGPITLSMPFQALLDTTTGTNIMIERAPL